MHTKLVIEPLSEKIEEKFCYSCHSLNKATVNICKKTTKTPAY